MWHRHMELDRQAYEVFPAERLVARVDGLGADSYLVCQFKLATKLLRYLSMFLNFPVIPSTFARIAAAFCCIALLIAPLEGALGQSKGAMDEKAIQILQQMSKELSAAKTISVRVKSFFDVVRESGIKIKEARSIKILLKRPNHVFAESVAESGAARAIWFDGKKLTVYRQDKNEYSTLDFNGSADQLFDHLSEKFGLNFPIADLLYSNAGKTFEENLLSSEYIGERTVQGVRTHQLSFESTGADWQIWIEADRSPLPRRFTINYVNEKGEPQFMAQLDQWSLGVDIAEENFRAGIPEKAKKVELKKSN
ncbi:MAG: DUF2092 domain-containing protein, partial [Desulfobulbia bacterium]